MWQLLLFSYVTIGIGYCSYIALRFPIPIKERGIGDWVMILAVFSIGPGVLWLPILIGEILHKMKVIR